MVRAIFIDPAECSVSVTDVPDVWFELRIKYEAEKLIRVATLPRGDAVYVSNELKDSPWAFQLGGSAPFRGFGLVLGRRKEFGLLSNALTPRDDVAALTKFCQRRPDF